MSEPEIARRCPQCGVSIRERTFFCPQCGKQFDWDQQGTERAADLTSVDQPWANETLAEPRIENLAITIPARQESPAGALVSKDNKERRKDSPPPEPASEIAGDPAVPKEKRFRATAAARDAIEDNVMQRVERLRKVSTVVIDEASYDPSLRFVLVAALLFGMFLLIVLLSKLIG